MDILSCEPRTIEYFLFKYNTHLDEDSIHLQLKLKLS